MITLRYCGVLTILAFVGAYSPARSDDQVQVPSFAPYLNISSDFSPSWSPDGKRIVYSSKASGAINLYVVSAAGGTPVPLTHDEYINTQPDWSRDGRRIVFSSNRSGSSQIWSMSADGTDLRQLTKLQGFCVQPRWSPDGQRVAFVAYPGPRVMLVASGGGEPREFARGLWPAWSNDGERIAYALASITGTTSVIAIRTVESGQERKLESSPAMSMGGQVDWSPNDQRLLCVGLFEGSSQILVLNVAADKVESTTQIEGSLYNPHWAPDGKRMAFTFADTGHPAAIQQADPSGANRFEITRHQSYTTSRSIRYQSADGLEIPSYLFLPSQPATQKRPALVWLHGGLGSLYEKTFDPQVQYFVDQGFIVLVPNYRSSGGFNKDLARIDATGRKELEDVVAGVAYLRGMPSVDASHIGVIGFSFGGLVALHAITQRPELFAAAVDVFGPTNLVTWYRDAPGSRTALMFGLGGTPEQKPEDYQAASPVNFVERIKTPLLMVHGDADADVPVSQAVEMADALKRAQRDYELKIIRGGDHGFVKQGQVEAMEDAMRFLSARLRISAASGNRDVPTSR